MGIYDRDYQKDSYSRREYFMSGGPFSHLPPVTRYILIINILVFLLTLVPVLGTWINTYFSVFPISYLWMVEVWRLISYQFLHATFPHILGNMLMLYFMGPRLEEYWGPKTYLKFYLISGAAGGVVYTLLVLFGILGPGAMVGASGAIYGIIAAVAVLFPNAQVYLFGIVPMRMMTLLIITVVWSVLNFMSGQNAGGEAAHLTGLTVGVFYVYVRPRMILWRMGRSKSAWQRKIEQQQQFGAEVDRILEKVHQSGVGSLTRKEKEILKEATRREQEEAAQARR
jgi:membrane associated rhomboid family serine protease